MDEIKTARNLFIPTMTCVSLWGMTQYGGGAWWLCLVIFVGGLLSSGALAMSYFCTNEFSSKQKRQAQIRKEAEETARKQRQRLKR